MEQWIYPKFLCRHRLLIIDFQNVSFLFVREPSSSVDFKRHSLLASYFCIIISKATTPRRAGGHGRNVAGRMPAPSVQKPFFSTENFFPWLAADPRLLQGGDNPFRDRDLFLLPESRYSSPFIGPKLSPFLPQGKY